MVLILFTGLPGSGKTSLAVSVKKLLIRKGLDVELIDGDIHREKFCKDLGFSKEDRHESIRRLFSIAEGLVKSKKIVLMSIINPYDTLRNELHKNNFVKLVYLDCLIENLIARDPKGMYKKALLPKADTSRIENFTGISDVFEVPKKADLNLKTDRETLESSTNKLFDFIIAILEKDKVQKCNN